MSPKEVLAAANLLNISVSDFKHLYVEEEQNLKINRDTKGEGRAKSSEQGWVKLRDQGKSNIATIVSDPSSLSACIFLDENNKCKIYEARPMQCLSYPFWPNIMASR
jgi:Fe-S-cluster containining protein